MATHAMIALKPLSYGSKEYQPGEALEVQGKHARLFAALKKAKFADEPALTKPAPKPAPAAPAAAPAPKSTAVPGMTTRQYKTRDLKPE